MFFNFPKNSAAPSGKFDTRNTRPTPKSYFSIIFFTFPKRFPSKVFYPHFLQKDACHAKCNTYLESPTKLPSEYHIYQLSIRKLNRYHIQTFHIYMKRVNLSN